MTLVALEQFEADLETKYSGKGVKLCIVSHYDADESPALQIVDNRTGEPLLTASVCVDQPAKPDCIIIKDWSENEGIEAALIKAQLIEAVPVDMNPAGFCVASEFKMRSQLLNAWHAHQKAHPEIFGPH